MSTILFGSLEGWFDVCHSMNYPSRKIHLTLIFKTKVPWWLTSPAKPPRRPSLLEKIRSNGTSRLKKRQPKQQQHQQQQRHPHSLFSNQTHSSVCNFCQLGGEENNSWRRLEDTKCSRITSWSVVWIMVFARTNEIKTIGTLVTLLILI